MLRRALRERKRNHPRRCRGYGVRRFYRTVHVGHCALVVANAVYAFEQNKLLESEFEIERVKTAYQQVALESGTLSVEEFLAPDVTSANGVISS